MTPVTKFSVPTVASARVKDTLFCVAWVSVSAPAWTVSGKTVTTGSGLLAGLQGAAGMTILTIAPSARSNLSLPLTTSMTLPSEAVKNTSFNSCP